MDGAHTALGSLCPGFTALSAKNFCLTSKSEFPLFLFKVIPPFPVTVFPCKKSVSLLLVGSLQVEEGCNRSPWSLLQAQHPSSRERCSGPLITFISLRSELCLGLQDSLGHQQSWHSKRSLVAGTYITLSLTPRTSVLQWKLLRFDAYPLLCMICSFKIQQWSSVLLSTSGYALGWGCSFKPQSDWGFPSVSEREERGE